MPIPTDTGTIVLPRPAFTFDKIVLVTTSSRSRLEQALPVAELRRLCPKFKLRPSGATNTYYRYRSNIQFTYTPDVTFWDMLVEHEAKLGDYRFNRMELAFDFPCENDRSASETVRLIAFSFRKLWHSQGAIRIKLDETKPPPIGIIQGPTFYFEKGKAITALKAYARYPKHGPKQDRPVARLEWTLKRADNIRVKTGIETIQDLLRFSSTEFFERWFRLERVDFEKLGLWLLRRERKGPDQIRHPGWAVKLIARNLTNQELRHMGVGYDELADFDHLRKLLFDKNLAPAVLRGLLKVRRAEGRPRYRDLTDHKINNFFKPVEVKFRDE